MELTREERGYSTRKDKAGGWNTRAPLAQARSCLYECSVMHHRLSPKVHQFRYRIFMFALDLDEIDIMARKVQGFSRNHWNFYNFRDRDHLTFPGGEDKTVKENILGYLEENGVSFPKDGRILLVTLPRVLGYIFNPVSFYFCEDAVGNALAAVVQVGNTFGEMKPYLIRQPERADFFRLVTPKHFFVSPFSELDLAFDFKLKVPQETLDIHIDDRKGNERVLLSALTGTRVPLTSAKLAWLTVKYPLITLKVIVLIHWQAFLLFCKRLPFYRKETAPELQRGVHRPHKSLIKKTL